MLKLSEFSFKFTAAEFDPAKRLNTHPALLHRTYNRPTTSMLETEAFPGTAVTDNEAASLELKVRIFF